MICMRLSGDIPTGSFAQGNCQGSSAFGSSPEPKANRVRAEQEGAAADKCKKATGGFTDKTGFAIQSWPSLPSLSVPDSHYQAKKSW